MLHSLYLLNKNFIFFYCELTESSSRFSKLLPGTLGEGRKVLALTQSVGIIKSWFNGENGYGFIHPDDGGEAVFVHYTCIAPHAKIKSLEKGARVTYEVAKRKMGGLWAKDVCWAD
jgi:CspA family cold shock protein